MRDPCQADHTNFRCIDRRRLQFMEIIINIKKEFNFLNLNFNQNYIPSFLQQLSSSSILKKIIVKSC